MHDGVSICFDQKMNPRNIVSEHLACSHEASTLWLSGVVVLLGGGPKSALISALVAITFFIILL